MLAFICYVTLSPLPERPTLTGGPGAERFLAFGLLGAMFVLAYPRHLFGACSVVLGSAVVLEIAQTITPDRHGRLLDAAEKLSGGSLGISVGLLLLYLIPRSWFET